jgi:hypothetical protein
MTPEDRTERTLGNGRDLADELELIILQPSAYTGFELGQDLERMGREKTSFVSRGYV